MKYQERYEVSRKIEKKQKFERNYRRITKDKKLRKKMDYFDRVDLMQELSFLKQVNDMKDQLKEIKNKEVDIDLFCECKLLSEFL